MLTPYVQRGLRTAHAGVNRGTSLKSGCFSAIGLSVVKTFADRHRHGCLP